MARLVDRKKENPAWSGTKRWQVRWENPKGVLPKSPAKSFTSREQAKAFLQDLETTLDRHGSVDLRAGLVTFEELAERWFRSTAALRRHTRRGYHRVLYGHVIPYFGTMPQSTITRTMVEEFRDFKLAPSPEMPNGYAPKSVRDMVSIVSLVMDYGMTSVPPLRHDNPAARIHLKVPRKKKKAGDVNLLSLADAEKLAEHIRKPYGPLVWALMYTGMRPAEACGLQVVHFDRKRNTLHLCETNNYIHSYGDVPAGEFREETKSEAGDRVVPLPSWAAKEITEMLGERERRLGRRLRFDEPLFEAVRGGPLNPNKLRRTIIIPALTAAKLNPAIRTYDVRHSAITMWIDAGVAPAVVAELAGHSDTRIQAQVYHHSDDKALRAGVEAMEKKRKKAAKKKAKKKANTGTLAPVIDIARRNPA